jgi:hypothetical protein
MVERQPIHVEPESEVRLILRRVGEEPLVVQANGTLYRIEREPVDPIEG